MKVYASILSRMLLLGVALLPFLATGCHQDEAAGTNTAQVTIHNPMENDVVAPGATLEIHATVVGQDALHGYELFLRNKATGVNLLALNEHAHGSTIDIHEEWVNTVDETSELELELIVTLDHEGNTTSKKVTFQAQK
jgi:hypothetical protein